MVRAKNQSLKQTLRFLLVLFALPAILACAATATTDADTADDTTDDTTDADDADSTAGTSLGNDVAALAANPCDAVGGLAYAIFAQSADDIWVGCAGSAGGLFLSSDGGESFTQVTQTNSGATSIDGDSAYYGDGGDPAPDVRFYDIEEDADGNILLCGGNNEDEVASKIFLYRVDATTGDYETLVTRDTLLNLGGTGFSDCDNVVATSDVIAIDDLSGSQVAYSSDNGATWNKYTADSVWDMIVVGSSVFGSGGTTGAGPEFYDFSASLAGLVTFDVDNAGDTLQDGRAIATPDSGTTFLIGTVDDDVEVGISIRYTTDDGDTFEDATIADPTAYSFVRAMACSGDVCIASGDTYPGSLGTGYIIRSEDGGLTWSAVSLSADIAPIYSITIFGDTAWFAGDGGNVYSVTL